MEDHEGTVNAEQWQQGDKVRRQGSETQITGRQGKGATHLPLRVVMVELSSFPFLLCDLMATCYAARAESEIPTNLWVSIVDFI